MILWHHF